MSDLMRADGPHRVGLECHDGERLAGEGRELHLKARTILMGENDGADSRQIVGQYDHIKLVNHGRSLSIAYGPAIRGNSPSASMNQTEHTIGIRFELLH
jgi:hypothetical protein